MAARLAQEELERVGGRLPRDLQRRRQRQRRRRRLAVVEHVVDDLDRALLELAEDQVGLERIEPERLEHVVQLRLAQLPALLRGLHQPLQVVAQQQDVGLDRHRRLLSPQYGQPGLCTIIGVMSSRDNRDGRRALRAPTSTTSTSANPPSFTAALHRASIHANRTSRLHGLLRDSLPRARRGAKASLRKEREFPSAGALKPPMPPTLDSQLHRARSAGRSKPGPRAVRGSGKPTGPGDESATGSVNLIRGGNGFPPRAPFLLFPVGGWSAGSGGLRGFGFLVVEAPAEPALPPSGRLPGLRPVKLVYGRRWVRRRGSRRPMAWKAFSLAGLASRPASSAGRCRPVTTSAWIGVTVLCARFLGAVSAGRTRILVDELAFLLAGVERAFLGDLVRGLHLVRRDRRRGFRGHLVRARGRFCRAGIWLYVRTYGEDAPRP